MKRFIIPLPLIILMSCASPHLDLDLGVSADAESQALAAIAKHVSIEYRSPESEIQYIADLAVDGVRPGHELPVKLDEELSRNEGGEFYAVAKDDAGTEVLTGSAQDNGEERVNIELKSILR